MESSVCSTQQIFTGGEVESSVCSTQQIFTGDIFHFFSVRIFYLNPAFVRETHQHGFLKQKTCLTEKRSPNLGVLAQFLDFSYTNSFWREIQIFKNFRPPYPRIWARHIHILDIFRLDIFRLRGVALRLIKSFPKLKIIK